MVRGFLGVVCFVAFQFSTGCGGGSSGSGVIPPPPPNPVPAIGSLNPGVVDSGGAGFTLTIAGENFVSTSVVNWNGVRRTTRFSSSTQLQAQIDAADIADAGSAAVNVVNPSPGGGNSGSALFTIRATSNPVPALTSLKPSTVDAGSSGFLLTLTGSSFIPDSTIAWNGTAVPTTYLSDTQLEATIPGSELTLPGFADVTVLNPAPGGGTSVPAVFSIAYVPRVVPQAANDLVWDPARQVIYLSVPSLAASNGNTIATLDPITGSIQSSVFAGSEPDALALSDDGQYLYAGVDGAASVQRFALPGLTRDVKFGLGADSFLGPHYAIDLGVAPGLAHTSAVTRGYFTVSPWGSGMAIYDDGVQRTTVAGGLIDSLQWGSATKIYANNAEVSSFDLYVLTANPSGVVISTDYTGEFSYFYISIHYDKGTKLVYSDDGYAVNPANGLHVGNFQAAGLMVPDSSMNRAFFLGQTSSQFGTNNFTIESFDLTTYTPLAEIVIPNVHGNPFRFIRWGGHGLAFNDDAGYVYIVNNAFVGANGAPLLQPSRYLQPVQKGGAARKMLRPAGVVPRRRGVVANPERLGSLAASKSNPVPTLTALTPSAVVAGINGFLLTAMGTDFMSFSTINWNGHALATEYLSSTVLQAQVSFTDVIEAGTDAVTVVTPGPGGGTSNALAFTALSNTTNPAPVINFLHPSSIAAGSAGFTLDVDGINFTASSVVTWNGSPRPSTLYSTGRLQVQIDASDIATAGYGSLVVTNPDPGGGTSNVAEFEIPFTATTVNQTTKDMIWDPLNQVIYLSIPATASAHANQICVLNPVAGVITVCEDAASEPDRLAISDDSQFLYVGEDQTASVQRFRLPSLTPDITFSLGQNQFGIPYYALDLQVAPGAPHTTAISLGILNVLPAAAGGIEIFDDSTPRPTHAPGWGEPYGNAYSSIQWGADATAIYAANGETTGFDFFTLTVDPSGVVLDHDYSMVFWNPGRIHYDRGSGLVYSDDGFHAMDPSSGLPAGIFEIGGGWPMAPDSTLDTVFIPAQYVWQDYGTYTLNLFDMTHYVRFAKVPFSTGQNRLNGLGRFIRWGSNGLALNDPTGSVYLISGPFVSGHSR